MSNSFSVSFSSFSFFTHQEEPLCCCIRQFEWWWYASLGFYYYLIFQLIKNPFFSLYEIVCEFMLCNNNSNMDANLTHHERNGKAKGKTYIDLCFIWFNEKRIVHYFEWKTKIIMIGRCGPNLSHKKKNKNKNYL